MAIKNRKTRGPAKPAVVRYRFESAADAKAVDELLSEKSTVDFSRTGRTIELPENKVKVLDKMATTAKVSGSIVRGRGRPKADDSTTQNETVGVSQRKSPAKKAAATSKPNSKTSAKSKVLKKKKTQRMGDTDTKDAVPRLSDVRVPGNKTKPLSRRLKGKRVKKPSERTRPLWRLAVTSTTIASAVYNVEKKSLVIEFLNKSRYRYDKVSVKEFIEFTTAESQGSWFSEHIKDVKAFVKLKRRPVKTK